MDSAALQELLDREAIRACLLRHARGLDRHDAELMRSAYHPDAIDHHGDFRGGPAEFAAWANDGHETHALANQHFLANVDIDLAGDVANVETYVFFALRRKDGDGVDLGGGRFLDRFERRDGHWLIAERELVMEWNCAAPTENFADVLRYPSGTWDRTDPSYRKPFGVTPA